MPIQTIRDSKTGEERRVFVSTGGMGAGAAPKPQAQPTPDGGFMGTLNDFNPMKQVAALGAGVGEFMRTGDLGKGIAAASKTAEPMTDLGQSVSRTAVIGAQRAADSVRYEFDRARLAREKLMSGKADGPAGLDLSVPSTGPGAPSAKNVRLPQWANYDDARVEPKNAVEDVLGNIIPVALAMAVLHRPMAGATALLRGLPGISQAATGFESLTTKLIAQPGVRGLPARTLGTFAREAVSGAPAGAVATYYTQNPNSKTLTDDLSERVKGTPLEPIVAKGLLIDPNDTVEQARNKQVINDAIWSIPLGGTLGTAAHAIGPAFRGVGNFAGGTKNALVDFIHQTIRTAQAEAAVKNAVEAPPAAAVPTAAAPIAPTPRVVSGKSTFSSEVYQGLRRQPLWEKTGVEIQGSLTPQTLPAESYTARLNYSDIDPTAKPVKASGKRYAEALAGQDQVAIESTAQKLQATFNIAAAKLGIEPGPNATSESWSLWDIGKQLYMNANPAKSNKPYVLGNPLTNIQVQSDIVDRMLGFELTKGVDAEGKRWKAWQLAEIGRKAREDAGITLGLSPDPSTQGFIPAPKAPATAEAAEVAFRQAQSDLIAATQRLQSEAAREAVTAPEPAVVPKGQLPGMAQPAYSQVGTLETNAVAVAPKIFQYKAEGQTATGRSGSLAEERIYDPRYGGVISVWRDTKGELGTAGQVYLLNGHNRFDLAIRSGFPVVNVQYIDAPTAAEARLVGALQNIKDDKGTGVDAAKIFRDTGMTIDDLRLQNVNLNGKLASEGVAMARLPQWLFDKAAIGELPTIKAVALGSAEGIDEAIISDVAKQATAGKWSADKITQAMQEAKFASASVETPGGVLPGFEELFKTSNVVALIDIRTAAFKQLSVEMRALSAASQAKNTSYLEAAGNAIDVEGSQSARKAAAEAVAVFNRVAGYEGPVRAILNELADQLPEGAGRAKAASNLVQFNLQRLRDAISSEINGPRLLQNEAVVRQLAEIKPVEAAPTLYADPLEAESLADARKYLGLPPTASAAQVARIAKQEGYDGIVFTGDFGLPGGKKEIDLRTLPEVKAPENAGNPAPIQAKPANAAPVPAENEAVSSAMERQALAAEAGDTETAGELGAWLQRRGVAVQPMGNVAAAAIEPSPWALPTSLAGLKPRYNYGQKAFTLEFETDLDKVAYTLAGDATGKPSKSHQKYRDWLEANGLDPADVAQYGATVVKPSIKEMAAAAEPGVLRVRDRGFGGIDFAAELPNLNGWQSVETGVGGTVGEGYTGATRITNAEAEELARIAYEISGITDFEIVDRLKVVYREPQARAYGDMSLVGREFEIAGYYAPNALPGERFSKMAANDQIRVAMTAYGAPRSFAQLLSTTYHESFHRLQRWFLTSVEQGILARSEKAIRELAAQNAESFGLNSKAAMFRDGTINLKEATAEAFAGFVRGLRISKEADGVFGKIKQLIDQTINQLVSRGQYKTWDDVFEKAALGQMKNRNGAGTGDMDVEFAADPPDPAEFARRIDQNMEALQSGDLTPEEIARMGASDVRRLTSRSGKTQYVPNAPDELIASNKALGEMLTSRAQQTGITSYSQPAIVKAALDQLDRDGWAVEPTITRLEAARRGDPKSQDDLIALAANTIHRDYLAAQNGMTAIEWQSTIDETDRATAMQRLWAGLEDQHRLDTSLMTATRKDGQRLSVMQIKHEFDPTHRQVPAGTMLYHGTTQQAAEAIVEDGFKAGSQGTNLLGKGVYFADTLSYAGGYGEVAAAGDLPHDVRILDLVAMDKRIADVVHELNLGPLETGGEFLYMSNGQKQAFRDWVVGQGYSGVRFDPQFELTVGNAAPETVIYDLNTANRIVGSKAVVEPKVPASNESMGTDIQAEITDPSNSIISQLEPEIRADIEQGVMSPKAVSATDGIAQVAIASRSNPGFGAAFNSMTRKVDANKLNQEVIAQMYRAALLWSAKTWTKMLVGSAYRAVTMPINQAIAETSIAGIATLKGDSVAASRAMRQARLDIGMYGQYVANWNNAWRLVGESMKMGESFGNLGASSMDMTQRNLRQDGQGSLFNEASDPANTLDNPWWLDPENTNMGAQFARAGWQAMNFSGRMAGTIDTFYSSMIGPSAEWGRIMGLELEKAEARGLTNNAAFEEASRIALDRIQSQWVDVAVNNKIIKDGAFTGVHAKTAMDWINFTDPLDVQFQLKTYEYGVAKAKEEGLTDTAAISKRAKEWMQEEPPVWAQRGMGVGQAVGWLPKALKDAIGHVPVLALLNPFPTSPANIAKAAARSTGFVAPFVDTFYRDIFSEDRNTRSRAIGEIATAYMTLTGGVLLATSGWVEFSGPGSYDPQVKAKMQRLNRQPYSIRFKNPNTGVTTRWWDLQALDTVSNVFALIGAHMDLSNSLPIEDRQILASNFVLATAEGARQVGFAQFTKDTYKSIGEIFNLVNELQNRTFLPTEGQIDPFSAYVEKRLAGFLPAIFNNMRKGADPYQRAIEQSTLPQPFAFAHELAQRFANKLPGLSNSLPPILHPLTGEPAVIDQVFGLNYLPPDQPWLKGAVNGFSPLAFAPGKQGTTDPVDIELARLSGRGTAFQIWNPNAFNVPYFKLNQTQLNKLAIITSRFVPPDRSNTLHGELAAMFAPGSSYWRLKPPEPSRATESSRAIRVNKAINHYKDFIKAEFLATEPGLATIIAENKARQEQQSYLAEPSRQTPWNPTP